VEFKKMKKKKKKKIEIMAFKREFFFLVLGGVGSVRVASACHGP
jgi:hypothetical protein